MTGRQNLTDLETHARSEADARLAGDAMAEQTAWRVRCYVPQGLTVTLPTGWCILVPRKFEVAVGGKLVIEADAILEVLP